MLFRDDVARVPRRDGISPNAVVVGFIGRLSGEKGLRESIEAGTSVRDVVSGSQPLLVGRHERHEPLPAQTGAVWAAEAGVNLVGENCDT